MNTPPRKKLLFDWHIPGFIDEVTLDVDAYLAAVDRMKPDSITVMGKSAFGCTYWDDPLGFKNPALKQNIFDDLVEPLRERGVQVIGYINVTLNDVVAPLHPEWHQISPEGEPVIKYQYHQLCMNSPYREVLYTLMADLAGKYAIDGFWFDLQYMHETGCFCPWCREGFEAKTGVALTPAVGDDPELNYAFHEFRRGVRHDFIAEAIRRLRADRPELIFGFNHAGDPRYCELETDALADFGSVEFHPPHFSNGGLNARVMRARNWPFELMLPESLGSWGDWTVMSRHTMRAMGAIAAAHGGAPIVGHVAYPGGALAGTLAEGVVETIADTFAQIDARQDLLEGAESVSVGASLLSSEAWRAVQAREGLEHKPSTYHAWLNSAYLMTDCNLHFDVLIESMFDRLPNYEYLVVSELEHVSDATAAALRAYVEGGGVLIALGRTGTADRFGRPLEEGALADLLGVDVVEEEEYSVVYIDRLADGLADGLPDMPMLFKAGPLEGHAATSRGLRCRAREGAEVWARFMEPCLEPDFPAGRHIYHRHSPPHTQTDWPAIVHNAVGKGHVVTINGPFGVSYGFRGSPWQRRLFMNILAKLGLPRALRIDGPTGVEVSFSRQGDRRLLHLVPRTIETVGSVQAADGWQVAGMTVEAECEGVSSVTLEPGNNPVRFVKTQRGITFAVPPFSGWTIVAID